MASRKHLRRADALYNARSYRRALTDYLAFIQAPAGVSRDRASLARAHEQIAECAERAGRYQQAVEARSRALTFHLEQEDREAISRTLLRLGEEYAFLGRYNESLRVIGLARELPSGDSTDRFQADSLRSLAISYGAIGQYQDQKSCAERALTIYQKIDHLPGRASAMDILAVNHRSQGELDDALDVSNQSLELAARAEDPDLAPLYLTLASIYRARGELRLALNTDEKALDAAKAGGVQEVIAVAEMNLGRDHVAFGELETARQAFTRALALFREAGADDDRAAIFIELGRIDQLEGNLPQAEDHLQQAIQIYTATDQSVGRAVAQSLLGQALLRRSKPAAAMRALALHESALETFRTAGERNGVAAETIHRGFALIELGRSPEALTAFTSPAAKGATADFAWRARHGEALALHRMGGIAASLEAYTAAIDSIEEMLVMSRVPEFRASFLGGAERLEVYDEAVELLIAQGRTEQALQLVERARARAFVDLLSSGRIDIRAGVSKELLNLDRNLRQRILEASARLARQAGPSTTPLGRGHAPDLGEQLKDLKRQHHRILERMAAESPELARLVTVQPVDTGTIQTRLGPGEHLLLYHLGSKKVRLFLISQRNLEVFELPVKVRKLRSLVQKARIVFEQRIPNSRVIRKLHEILIAPVQSRLTGEALVIVPHDILHYLPFQTLLDQEGRYLIEKAPISYVPSATALAAAGTLPGPDRSLLALANPEAGLSVPSLPFTTSEVAGLGQHFARSRVLLGSDAKEAELKKKAAGYDVIHLACHGELDPDLPLYSGLALAAGDGEDGRLELHEVFGLDLKADLVVLSACNTGLGKLSRGDELVCLARSFLHSGSKSVLASLWSVSDESTARLMTRFHQRLAMGDRKDRALQAATREMLGQDRFKQPYLWAAFCLMGQRN